MTQVIAIAANHTRVMYQNRASLALLLVVPLALAIATGLAGGGGGVLAIPVAIVDQDAGAVAGAIVDALAVGPYSLQHVSEETARQLVADREVSVAVFIPAAASQDLAAGVPVRLTILRSSYQESPRLLEHRLDGLLTEVRAAAAAAALARSHSASWDDAFELALGMWRPNPPVDVEVVTVTDQVAPEVPTGYQHSSPGFAVMFAMMGAVAGGAATLISEREGGTLGRLVAAPLSRGQILGGKAMGIWSSAVLQLAILIGFGRFALGVNWGSSLAATAMIALALAAAATGMGMFLAAICRTSAQANAVGVLAVLVMSMLGGSWWPLEIMPDGMRTLARLTPSGWAMDGFTAVIMRGAGPAHVIEHVLVLLSFALVFMVAGTVLFRHTD